MVEDVLLPGVGPLGSDSVNNGGLGGEENTISQH